MESKATEVTTTRWRPSRRALTGAVLALALGAVMVTGVSANGGPGGGRGDITITAINGSQLTLATSDGWTRTLDATGVKVVNGTTTLTLADLKVGDEIDLSQSRNFDGSVAVTQISVVAPSIEGTVSAIDASTLTVRQTDGSSKTVTLTSTTTYSVNGQTATHDAIAVGTDVNVKGTANADGSFTATSVSTHPADLAGTVTAKTADSITIADASGATAIIKVGASTTYRTAAGTGALADVTVGAVVRAEGTLNADGSLTATSVGVGTAGGDFGGPGDFGGHHGGPGGPGHHGPDGGDGQTPPTSPTATPSASPSA